MPARSSSRSTEGSISLGTGVALGNDGYGTHARSRAVVDRLVAFSRRAGLRLESFGVSADGCTWAAIIALAAGSRPIYCD